MPAEDAKISSVFQTFLAPRGQMSDLTQCHYFVFRQSSHTPCPLRYIYTLESRVREVLEDLLKSQPHIITPIIPRHSKG